MTRRPRTPSSEEVELWGRITDTVEPLAPTRKKPTTVGNDTSDKAASRARAKPPVAPPPFASPQPPVPKKPPALATMDRRARSRLSRGVTTIDRRIDLHGLTQIAAEVRLKRFLRAAQEDGAKVVLVITGKGNESEERGVLRRMAPHWLGSPDMRDIVVGFEEAARGHGGSGALYVRIRRAR
jgi:DNA-nicking Smr family endonuclease